jgi:hypothetical protein
LLKHDISLENLNVLLLRKLTAIVLFKLIPHIAVKSKIFSGLKELEDKIIRFKHIKIINLRTEDVKLVKLRN